MRPRNHSLQVRLASGMNVLLGGALIASPWLLGYASRDGDLTQNSVVIGAFILICAALRAAWPAAKPAWSAANIAFGFWTMISAWTFGSSLDRPYALFSIALGLAVMLLASWSGNATLSGERDTTLHDRD